MTLKSRPKTLPTNPYLKLVAPPSAVQRTRRRQRATRSVFGQSLPIIFGPPPQLYSCEISRRFSLLFRSCDAGYYIDPLPPSLRPFFEDRYFRVNIASRIFPFSLSRHRRPKEFVRSEVMHGWLRGLCRGDRIENQIWETAKSSFHLEF